MQIRVHARFSRRRPLAWLADLLILGGVVCLAIWGWAIAEGFLYQHFQGEQFAKHSEGPTFEAIGEAPVQQVSVPDTSASALRALPRPRLADLFRPDPQLMGRLEAPGIDLSVLVREGVDDETLRRAVGHLPSSALPGQPGNFVLLGHRDTFFRALRNIHRGDALRIQTRTDEFTYVVDSLEVTDPDAIRLPSSSEPSATLITCYPFKYIGPAPRRFVVRATLANAPSAENSQVPAKPRTKR